MKRSGLLLVILIFASTCFAQRKKCRRKDFKNLYKGTTILDYQTVFKKDSITYKQLKFTCASWFLTSRAMFNKLGKWEGTLHSENHNDYSILVWDEVELLSNQQLFTVITFGYEDSSSSSSFIVLEKDGRDALASSSIDQNKLATALETLVIDYGYKNDQFMEVYRNDRDTSHYKDK